MRPADGLGFAPRQLRPLRCAALSDRGAAQKSARDARRGAQVQDNVLGVLALESAHAEQKLAAAALQRRTRAAMRAAARICASASARNSTSARARASASGRASAGIETAASNAHLSLGRCGAVLRRAVRKERERGGETGAALAHKAERR